MANTKFGRMVQRKGYGICPSKSNRFTIIKNVGYSYRAMDEDLILIKSIPVPWTIDGVIEDTLKAFSEDSRRDHLLTVAESLKALSKNLDIPVFSVYQEDRSSWVKAEVNSKDLLNEMLAAQSIVLCMTHSCDRTAYFNQIKDERLNEIAMNIVGSLDVASGSSEQVFSLIKESSSRDRFLYLTSVLKTAYLELYKTTINDGMSLVLEKVQKSHPHYHILENTIKTTVDIAIKGYANKLEVIREDLRNV